METKLWTVIFQRQFDRYDAAAEFRRCEQQGDETIEDMLRRENLLNEVRYLFEGHPKLKGE